jgi:hypothetical protein
MNLENVKDRIWYSVGNSVSDPMRKSVWDFLRDSVKYPVYNSVVVSVWDSVDIGLQEPIREERAQG